MINTETDLINDLYIELNLPYAKYTINPKAWIKAHPNNKIPREFSYDEIVNSTKSAKNKAKYLMWLEKRHKPKLVYGLPDIVRDYPQYDKDKAIADLDRKRELTKDANRYHKQLTNF